MTPRPKIAVVTLNSGHGSALQTPQSQHEPGRVRPVLSGRETVTGTPADVHRRAWSHWGRHDRRPSVPQRRPHLPWWPDMQTPRLHRDHSPEPDRTNERTHGEPDQPATPLREQRAANAVRQRSRLGSERREGTEGAQGNRLPGMRTTAHSAVQGGTT